MDKFDHLLFELGKILDIDLHPDQNRACLLVINDEYRVQLEVSSKEELLLMGSHICEIPPGKFRENVFKEAMKFNNQPPPRYGHLGYVEKINALSCYHYVPMHSVEPQKISTHLGHFIDTVVAWKTAIKANQVAPSEFQREGIKKPSIFDVRP